MRRLKQGVEIYPDEILLDSSNIPNFDTHQFEGRLERPISQIVGTVAAGAFVLLAITFTVRVAVLQIEKGAENLQRSERNSLNRTIIFPQRGVALDRNNIALAWNIPPQNGEDFSLRRYIDGGGFAHILGYVKYPSKDKNGLYYEDDFQSFGGVEEHFNSVLKGNNGVRIVETDVFHEIHSESVLQPPRDGRTIRLSIDARVQQKMFDIIRESAQSRGFEGGAGVIIDIKSGELLSLVSFPEFDSNVLSYGRDTEAIERFRADPHKPFLNRPINGLYSPGSIVKPFIAVGALSDNIIDPYTEIESTGSIELPHPYEREKKSVFLDWKAHGWVDMRRAIAVSSNVYFYVVGGGFEGRRGLGISAIAHHLANFGFGRQVRGESFFIGEVGTVPTPEWKAKNFSDDPWRIGDTYHTAIGQYGFQITPLQVTVAMASIANGGKIPTPTVLLGDGINQTQSQSLPYDPRHLEVVSEGLRQAVTEGTAQGLLLPFVEVAAKTGTAEVGLSKQYVNSWAVGFFPYRKPRFAFAVILEKGPSKNRIGAFSVIKELLEWIHESAPEYLNGGPDSAPGSVDS